MSTLSSAGIAYAQPDWRTFVALADSSLKNGELASHWSQKKRYTIVETGFGCGLNFLTTVQNWLSTQATGELHYIAIEDSPWQPTDIERAISQRPQLKPLVRQFLEKYPAPLRGWQRIEFPQWRVTLDFMFGDINSTIADIAQPVDSWFLNGRSADNIGCLAPHEPLPANPKSALVIGAGLAGSAVAAALAKRGVVVSVLDALPAPAAATSGNPVAAMQGRYHRKQDHLGRWAQAATRCVLAELAEFSDSSIDRQRCGSIHMLNDSDEQNALTEQLQLPASVGQWLSATEASERSGVAISSPALWQPEACVVNPAKLTMTRLSSSSKITTLCDSEITSLEYNAQQWHALNSDGTEIATADIAILATGAETGHWLPWLPLQLARGQLTAVSTEKQLPRTIVGYGGQAMPPQNGLMWLGATAARQPLSTEVLQTEHSKNLDRLAAALPALHRQLNCTAPTGRAAIRCKYPDHLPIAGEIAATDVPGLYLTAAHGARGVSNSSICGEIIAGLACGNPPPHSLLAAAAPARAWRRHMKKSEIPITASPLDGTPIQVKHAK